MADNIDITPGSGKKVATDEATYSGDTASVQLVRLVDVSGAEGSKTVVPLTLPVSIAGTVAVSGSFYQATQPVSIASMPSTPVTGTFWQATQPVSIAGTVAISAASLPLPTGAATLANQSTLNTNIGSSADGILTTGTAGSLASYMRTIMEQSLSTAPSSIKIDQTTPGTTNGVVNTPATTAYALIPAPSTYRLLSAAASTNGANIKASAGCVKGLQGFNNKASAVYLKLYNKASSPTVGTDTPVKTIYLPASAAFAIDFGTGVSFATGISIALTGAAADADTTALSSGDIVALNVDYH
jgi:hypothetical protein